MCKDILSGKKLLILAGGPNLITLVQRAKELGVYTIVTDYYDCEKSPAKKYADEFWSVSWSDIDALERMCIENKVDGVTTGYSESTVECCIKLCERLGLPCYCTLEQLNVTKDKIFFKNECRKNGVPVVNEYNSVEKVTNFPIIVKPVDRAGSIGVSVATNRDELLKAYEYAMEKSYCKNVIIEDFIQDGSKFDVTYAICNGEPTLLSTCDTVNAKENGFERVVQSGWLFPSKYNTEFLNCVDKPIRKMIKSLKINDGYIFFSGFAIPKGEKVEFVFFETGFRLSGGHMYNYMIKRGIVNLLDIFIVHALTGSTKFVKWQEEKIKGLKCVAVNYYAKDGVIAEIKGDKEISQMQDCNFSIKLAKEGQVCDSQHAILSKLHMFHFCNESAEELAQDIKAANDMYAVKSTTGLDMVYDRINPEVIKNWWSKR